MVSVPLPGNLKSVARYWSPKAWRPMMIGLVQPGTSRGTFLQMMGSRNTTPPRMLRMVPFGDFHISLSPNSFPRPSSGVMVAHLTPTPTFLMALAASTVTWSLVLSRYSIPRSKYIRLISRNGVISLSLMYCQMIRVISSPSSSTTGLVTLIFAMEIGPLWNSAGDGGMMHPRYSTADAVAKAKALCSFSPSFGLAHSWLWRSAAGRLWRLQACPAGHHGDRFWVGFAGRFCLYPGPERAQTASRMGTV